MIILYYIIIYGNIKVRVEFQVYFGCKFEYRTILTMNIIEYRNTISVIVISRLNIIKYM